MKTIYKCDICGKSFSDWKECSQHEDVCKETHATGCRLTATLNDAVKSAADHGSVTVAICANDCGEAYHITGARYIAATRKVIIDIADGDAGTPVPPIDTEEGSDNA